MKGELDLAVVLSDSIPQGLLVKPLRSEPLCFVVSPRHPLALKKVVSLKDLNSAPFALGVKGNEFSDMVDEILQKHRIPHPTLGFTISNLQGRKEAARAGVGVAVLPVFAVREEIRNKTLVKLTIKSIELNDTRLLLIEPNQRPSKPSVELVKQVLEKTLSS